MTILLIILINRLHKKIMYTYYTYVFKANVCIQIGNNMYLKNKL